jgi:tripartite-type tricarboxylate transporter receptor subunit TctC
MTDLLTGQVQVVFANPPPAIEQIRAGNVRALAVTTAARSDLLPDVPTIGESLPGYEASGWQGIGAPKNTPPDIVRKLNVAINAALADVKIKTRFADLGSSVWPGTPGEITSFVAEETEKWEKVIRAANIKI